MSRTRRIAVAALSTSLVLATLQPAQAAPIATFGSSVPHVQIGAQPHFPASLHAAGSQSAIQAALLNETNAYRASRGLAPLSSHQSLDSVAQSWSETMARERTMRHNPSYVASYPSAWRRAAENVGTFNQAVAARDMLQAWINSPGHRRNLENPAFTHIGVGWATAANGAVYATQNFATL